MDPDERPAKYTYLGQFTLTSNSLSVGIDNKYNERHFDAAGFRSGLWNIWYRKKGNYIKEIRLLHRADDSSKNPPFVIYDVENYTWESPKHFPGTVCSVMDTTTPRSKPAEGFDSTNIQRLVNGIVIKNTSKKVKYTNVTITGRDGMLVGLQIRYHNSLKRSSRDKSSINKPISQ